MTDPDSTASPIRVMLVDDQKLLRQGFWRLLEMADGIEVVGAAPDGQEAIAMVEQLALADRSPDVVLMDVRMPHMDGVQATAQIRVRWPEVRVVMLTTFDDEAYVIQGLQAGAQGYLLKDASTEELIAAIRATHRGESPLQPAAAAKLVAWLSRGEGAAPSQRSASAPSLALSAVTAESARPPSAGDELTERERDILRHLARGASNREIGETLFITEGTVKNHVSSILSKLALRDRTQAALWAREHGLG